MTQDNGISTYSIGTAHRLEIGKEWNDVKWNKDHFQIQYHRLYYPISGRAKLLLLDKELDLVAGRVYFIPAFSIAESHIDGRMEKYYIHFQAEQPLFEMYRYLSDKYSVEASSHTQHLFDLILSSYRDNSYAARMRVQGAMNLIMADFLDGISLERGGIAKFAPVLAYINEHFRENISLATLAELMNISTMYFSGFFKRTFNISPKQYILNKRLTESQRLLLETDLSVKEVAYAVGFENENYFSEYFSAKVGIPALRFRQRRLS